MGRSIAFFFFYKKNWKFLLQIRLKCKLNCMQNSPMIYSDTSVFLRIACSLSEPLSEAIKPTIVAQRLFRCPPFCHWRSSSMWRFARYLLSRFTSLDACIHLRKSLYWLKASVQLISSRRITRIILEWTEMFENVLNRNAKHTESKKNKKHSKTGQNVF